MVGFFLNEGIMILLEINKFENLSITRVNSTI